MKKLSMEQMENTSGGSDQCGKIGSFFGVGAMVLMVATLVTNPITIVGGLILAHSISFGIVSGGCELSNLLT